MTFDDFVQRVERRGGTVTGRPKHWVDVAVDLRGHRNAFTFAAGSIVRSCQLTMYGSHNCVRLKTDARLVGMVKIGQGCTLEIGKNLTVTGDMRLHLSEETSLTIGDDCMFGVGVSIYTHDYHPIFDLETGDRINLSESVHIGSHVWIGNHATLLKGVRVGAGSVVGAHSIVSDSAPLRCIVAGNPARVVRRGIAWSRASLNLGLPAGIANHDELDDSPASTDP